MEEKFCALEVNRARESLAALLEDACSHQAARYPFKVLSVATAELFITHKHDLRLPDAILRVSQHTRRRKQARVATKDLLSHGVQLETKSEISLIRTSSPLQNVANLQLTMQKLTNHAFL
jgi:hypothetical protein